MSATSGLLPALLPPLATLTEQVKIDLVQAAISASANTSDGLSGPRSTSSYGIQSSVSNSGSFREVSIGTIDVGRRGCTDGNPNTSCRLTIKKAGF